MQPEGLPWAAPILKFRIASAFTTCETGRAREILTMTGEAGDEPIRAVDLG